MLTSTTILLPLFLSLLSPASALPSPPQLQTRTGTSLNPAFDVGLVARNNQGVEAAELDKRYWYTTVRGKLTLTRWRADVTTVTRNGMTFTRSYTPPTSSSAAAPPASKSSSVPSAKPPSSSSSSKPTSSSSSSSAANASPSGATGSLQQRALSAHNEFRALHGAKALVWSDTLAAGAQKWANNCVWEHSKGAVGPWGENLAATAGSPSTITDGIKLWSDEASQYDPNNPTYSHFTQEVWKSTTQLGCASALCPAGGLFDASYGPWTFYVCEYNPPGNVAGQYAANVQV